MKTKIQYIKLMGHSERSAAAAKLLQLCPTPCDPIDSSPPGSAVPGILQARVLEWVATAFSERSAKGEIFSYKCYKKKQDLKSAT